MTKSELIESVTSDLGGRRKKDIEGVVNTIFCSMTNALVRGDRVEIRGLGSFRVKVRQPRVGRNPKTGESVAIPARRVPAFTVGKHLRSRVQSL